MMAVRVISELLRIRVNQPTRNTGIGLPACSLAIFLLLLFVSVGQSQEKKDGKADNHGAEQTSTPTPEPGDTLGRSTPHGTLVGFLHAAQHGRYDDASQYLRLSKKEKAVSGEHLAQQLHALLDEAFVGRIGAVSDNPEGSHQAGVPSDHERIGVFRVNGREADADLVRVYDPSAGQIWLFSSQTLTALPELADELEESEIESHMPWFLVREQILGTPLWRWAAFLLLIPVALGLSWGIVRLLGAGRKIWLRLRRHRVLQNFYQAVAPPAIFILTIIFHWIGVTHLGFSLLFRDFYRRFAGMALALGVAWLLVRLINIWAEQARLKALKGVGHRSAAIVLLGQRILKVIAVIVALLAILSILGVDITAALAGLGISSIAIAFAAQKTLENLLGGISILGDEVIRVGEACHIGDYEGTVEDISLRSTRIRTLAGSEVSVPNGQLANMSVENLSRRDMRWFHAKFGLRMETSPDQLRSLLEHIRTLLSQHPKVDPNAARVRFVGFGESSLDVEIDCRVLIVDLHEFFAVREQLYLGIMDLIAQVGSGLAAPARILYQTGDSRMGEQRPGNPNVVAIRPRS
jgi:MscS family membrane protein